MKQRKISQKVLDILFKHYNTQTTCAKCGDLLEANKEIYCNKCSLRIHIKTNLEMAKTAHMRIEQEIKEKLSEKKDKGN